MKRRKGRAKMYDTLVSLRVNEKTYALLQAIALFEHFETADLLRLLLLNEQKVYRRDRLFQSWLKRHRAFLAQQGIDITALFGD